MATAPARQLERAERPISLAASMARSQEQHGRPDSRRNKGASSRTSAAFELDDGRENNRLVSPMRSSGSQLRRKTANHDNSSSSSSSSSSTPGSSFVLGPQARPQRRPIKRTLLNQEKTTDGQLKTTPTAAANSRRPLRQVTPHQANRWKSSSEALNSVCNSAAAAAAAGATRLAKQKQSTSQLSRGQWCCELPHHASAAHLSGRRASKLSPLFNKIQLDLNGLRGRRAASSLALTLAASTNTTANGAQAACTRPPGSADRLASRQVAPIKAQPAPSKLPTASATVATASGAAQAQAGSAQNSQVTNSRLRQGALFARRQLHLLPVEPLAIRAPAACTTSLASGTCANASRGQQQVGIVAARTRPFGQANTAAEARRRATRSQLLPIATPTLASNQRAPQASDNNNNNNNNFATLIKAQKEASQQQLSSSSSSLSLDAFVVKRPRKQQHSSGGSSCSSISVGSRRWSTSSSSGLVASAIIDCATLSQSCLQLADQVGRANTHKTTSSQQQSVSSSATDERQPKREEERTRFQAPLKRDNDQCERRLRSASKPKHFNTAELANDSRQPSDCSNLLAPTLPPSQTGHPIELANKRRILVSELSNNNHNHTHTHTDQHALQVQKHATDAPDKQTDFPTTTDRPSGTLEELDEHIDIVPSFSACSSPSGFAPAPSQSILNDCEPDKTTTSHHCAPFKAPLNDTTSCNTNNQSQSLAEISDTNNCHECQLQSDLQGAKSTNSVDMMISGSLTGEACVSCINHHDGDDIETQNKSNSSSSSSSSNNNNNIIDPQQVVSMQDTISLGEERMLLMPLDLSKKSQQDRTNVTAQATPTTPKSQPLGLHQSINTSAPAAQLLDRPEPIGQNKLQHDDHCCAIGLTLGQAESMALTVGVDDERAPRALEEAQRCQKKKKSALVKQRSAEIPIRLEPICEFYDLEVRPFARGKFAQVKRCTRKNSTATMSTKESYAAKCIKKRRRLVDIKHEILLEIEALKLSYETERIVRLYEVYETPSEMILILEMAKGGELQRVLDDEEQIEEPLARKMIDQILEGLIYLHDNEIAHLDIKPQNLLLSKPFPDGDIKLCDFGISRRITRDCEIREICGTPDYVAPEILRYDPISLATDMWSLGVLTYVLLSGYTPFGSENKQQTFCNITQATLDFPSDIFGAISSEAVDFISKLIVREPSGRLTSRQAKNHHWISTTHRT